MWVSKMGVGHTFGNAPFEWTRNSRPSSTLLCVLWMKEDGRVTSKFCSTTCEP